MLEGTPGDLTAQQAVRSMQSPFKYFDIPVIIFGSLEKLQVM